MSKIGRVAGARRNGMLPFRAQTRAMKQRVLEAILTGSTRFV